MGNSQAAFKFRDTSPEMRSAVLNGSPSVTAIAKRLADGSSTRVVALVGAGISVAAGVPDFRSPGTGLYENLAKYNLPHPTAVFDLAYFRSNPRPFYQLAREIYPAHAIAPTHAHYFLKMLHEKGRLQRVYTQNIDMLETVAGLPRELIVEAHGSFASSTCQTCGKRYDAGWLEGQLFPATEDKGDSGQGNKVAIPTCELCSSVVKPDITFFGEALPERFGRLLPADLAAADMLIVMGTSLQVYPVAAIPSQVGPYVPRVLINREVVGAVPRATARAGQAAPPAQVTSSPSRPTKSNSKGQGTPGRSPAHGKGSKPHASAAGGRSRSNTTGSTTSTGTDGGLPLPSDAEDQFLADAIRDSMALNDDNDDEDGKHEGRLVPSRRGSKASHGHGDELSHYGLARDYRGHVPGLDDSQDSDEIRRDALASSGREGKEGDEADAADAHGMDHDNEDDELYGDLSGHGSWGFRFGLPDNYRDVLLQGDVEDGVLALARECGWLEDLQDMTREGREAVLKHRADRLQEGRRAAATAGQSTEEQQRTATGPAGTTAGQQLASAAKSPISSPSRGLHTSAHGSPAGTPYRSAAAVGVAGAGPTAAGLSGLATTNLLVAQADAAVAGSPLPLPVVDMRPIPAAVVHAQQHATHGHASVHGSPVRAGAGGAVGAHHEAANPDTAVRTAAHTMSLTAILAAADAEALAATDVQQHDHVDVEDEDPGSAAAAGAWSTTTAAGGSTKTTPARPQTAAARAHAAAVAKAGYSVLDDALEGWD